MNTINQIIRLGRKPKRHPGKPSFISGRTQRKCMCTLIKTMSPRKPNSALRKVAKVSIIEKGISKTTTVYIPGIGHDLQMFSIISIKGPGVNDLPGVNYRVIRGRYDASGVTGRKNARSRYGTKKMRVKK